MAKSTSKEEVEFHPDAWARFERAAGVVVKSPPQHRKYAEPKVKKAKKKRAKKKSAS